LADKKVELTVQINAETGQLEIVQKGLEGVSGKAKETQASFSGLTGEAGSLLKSFLPFATATGIIAFFTSAVKGAEEEAQALQRLKFSLEATSQSYDKNKQSVLNWANEMQKSTRFSDGEALNALEKLVRATGNVTQAQKASQLAMNMSVASNKSLAVTTELVNDLLNGQQRAVLQARNEFGNLIGSANTAQEVLDILQRRVGDAAFKEEGLTRSTYDLRNAFDDFKKQVGVSMTPAVTEVVTWATSLIRWFDKLGNSIGTNAFKLGEYYKMEEAKTNWHFNQTKENYAKMLEASENYGRALRIIREANKVAETGGGLTPAEQKTIDEGALRAKEHKDAEALRSSQEKADKIAAIEYDLDQKIAGLDTDQFAKKRKLNELEYNEKSKALDKLLGKERSTDIASIKLEQWRTEQAIILSKEEANYKTKMSFQIAETAIQTLQTINAMGEKGSAAERVRAKALLALQQAIAIGWVWVNAAKTPWGMALAGAQTALIVAQFASQLKAIDRAASAEKAGMEGIQIESPAPGITPTPIEGGGGGGITVGGGVAVSAGGGGGGGGGGNVINVGGIHVNFDVESLSTENVDMVMRKIYEKLRQATIEGVQLAVAMKNTAAKYGGMAV